MTLSILFLGLSVTSSWGNGHATTYRGLMRELVRRGHRVTFLERDMPWYADNRDLPKPPYGRTMLYASVDELKRRWSATVTAADVIILGSFVPDGIEIARWLLARSRGLTAFYDIDTPVTIARLGRGDADYITVDLIPEFDLYLSFTGGPTLNRLEREFGAKLARALHCSADTEIYKPLKAPVEWNLGYIGTYSDDRQPALDRLLLEPMRRLPGQKAVVAGPQYPEDLVWPENVERIEHLAPDKHRAFYAAQRFTVNVTRRDMVKAGWSPSIRLFEAAATGTPIISDWWTGLDAFFRPGEEILIAESSDDVTGWLEGMPEEERHQIAKRARARVLAEHTAAHRAAELERLIKEAIQKRRDRRLLTRITSAAPIRPAAS